MHKPMQRDDALRAIEQTGCFESVRWVHEVDSTNHVLATELKSNSPPALPALLVADRQTAGVGRGSNTWWSPSGCLMFSMAVPWSGPPSDRAKMPLVVGLAVAQALAEWSASQPKVKWPNDVYIEDRKICGILIESSTRKIDENIEEYSIIGIGINCVVDFNRAPEALRSTAISLHEAAPRNISNSISPESVLLAVVNQWMALRQRLNHEPDWIDREWPHWSWLDGRWVEVVSGDGPLTGIAKGIDSSGALKIEDRFGRTHAILSGTVRAIAEGSPYR
jgi:BirA family transcriptional regulator, biotin operon repressor / biotin---[acetyl-CoA-carboxylase] ligase